MALKWTRAYAQIASLPPCPETSNDTAVPSTPFSLPSRLLPNIPRGPVNWTGPIFIDTVNSGRISLDVASNNTIFQIKQLYYDLGLGNGIWIFLNYNGLKFAGKTLRDSSTLDECGIQRDSALTHVWSSSYARSGPGYFSYAEYPRYIPDE